MLTIRPFVSRNFADLQRVIGPNDYIVSRHKRTESAGNVTYMAWPSATAANIYQYVSSLPVKSRALHSIFGRPSIPMDFCADLDLPLNPADRENQRQGVHIMERVCDEASNVLDTTFQKKFQHMVVLQSLSRKKISYHIHARVDDHTAFADFNEVKQFVFLIQAELEKDKLPEVIDTHIYRSSGSLRAFDCVKSVGEDVPLSHIALKRPDSWQPLPEELFDMSLAMRKLTTITTKLEFKGSRKIYAVPPKESVEKDAQSLRYIATNVPKLNVKSATEYKTWLGVSLALKGCHQYTQQNPDAGIGCDFKQLFHNFSGLSPKYSYSNCERWWGKFKVDPHLARSAGYVRKMVHSSKE
ncbi:mitochondrial DNA primase [Perkinsela sp. CCAP 1560/4]|nr:mitochondrial DNA primase [Perkinsela sp. CCAP 1560/4]|eukprot:KNH04214.1 mitochondrial DNA primase [Perkinsela sp. CCAP 1560/4]